MVTAVKRPAGETRGKVAAGPDTGQMPPRQLPTLQRLSADHFVLELDQDEGGSGDVADRGRAEHNVLQGALPLGHQREAAFALVAQGSQQRVTGFRVDVQLAAGGLLTGANTPAPALPHSLSRLGTAVRSGTGGPAAGPARGRSGHGCCRAGRPRPTAARRRARPAPARSPRAHAPCRSATYRSPCPSYWSSCPRTGRRRRACRPGSGREVPAQRPRPGSRAAWGPSRRVPRRPRPCTGTRWPGRSRNPGPAAGCLAGSRNQARAKTACFQQVRARVPARVPISRRCSASRPDTNSTSGSGTSRMTR
jgi:hypothetical protein